MNGMGSLKTWDMGRKFTETEFKDGVLHNGIANPMVFVKPLL
jgi:hypothetical protein